MGLSSALSVAGSGLRTSQNWAEITSRNIANASTEGYVRKDVQLGTLSGGVEITAVRREIDIALEKLDRDGISQLGRWRTISDALEIYTATLGQPGDAISPAARLTQFQESLNALANKPGDAAIQATVLAGAERLTASLNEAADMLSGVAQEVELSIRYDVADVNALTRRLADLNGRIVRAEPESTGHGELADTLGRIVDTLAGYMDVRTVTGHDGQVKLFTAGGTALVDGTDAAVLEYNQGTGTLSVGGQAITPSTPGIRGFENGSLAGLFALRNETLPAYGLQLDEMARALVTEFEAADASRAPGQPGLFTDGGAAFSTVAGLAGRLAVNAAVDPQQGGALWRLRDGVGAAAPGAAADPTQTLAFIDIFNAPLGFDPATGIGASMTLEAYTTAMVAAQHAGRTDAQSELEATAISSETFAAARQNYAGVNTDEELQKLMLIEQSYAANAKLMTTVSQMMDALLAAV